MRNIVMAGMLATSLLSGPAFAETSAGQPGVETGGAAMSTTAATGGMQMGDKAASPVKFADAKPADLMSSKLVGLTVYNNNNETVGQIEDMAIDNGKTIKGVIVSVGGFLGMGEHYVLVDPASITLAKKDGSLKAFMDTNKETLKSAPAFTYNKNKA